jgi:GDPmannose 4,6-dehydratase
MSSTTKRALITGISGQAGSYLAELLLGKGYEVHGIVRRSSSVSTARIAHIVDKLKLHEGDLTDSSSLAHIAQTVTPTEVYNLGAQSHVRVSFDQPELTTDVAATGTLRLLEALRQFAPKAKFYQASTSEMFGSTPPPQSETTRFHPRSPYGCAKLYAHHIAINYRESYGMFVACGILFNMESPRRGEAFVTKKITRAAARIKLGLQDKLFLGNLDAVRDWGFVGDYVDAMWRMLQQDKGDEYVVATGQTRSIREFLDAAFGRLDLDWSRYVVTDAALHRPAEVNALCGDPSKARRVLGWEPTMTFAELASSMVDHDMKTEKALKAEST